MEKFLKFWVPGIPRPAGSKRAFPIQRKNGQLGVAVSDMSGEKGKTWRSDLIGIAASAMIGKEPIAFGPIRLEVLFILPRPRKHHSKRGGLKDSAPVWHFYRPDVSKLLRAIEDALTGTIWKDDAQVAQQIGWKIYGPKPGAQIRISTLEIDDDFEDNELVRSWEYRKFSDRHL